LKANEYNRAVACIESDLAKDPEDIALLKNLAQVYIEAGSDLKAIETINTIIKLDPEDVALLKNLARIYTTKGMDDKAIKTIKTIIKLDPEDKSAFDRLFNLYMKQKAFDKAIVTAQNKLKQYPQDIDAYSQLATVYFKQKLYQRAITVIEDKILKTPKSDAYLYNANIYFLLGNNYKALKQSAKALENYKKTLALNADHLMANITAGEICNETGELKEMIQFYTKALQQNDELPNAHNDIAWAYATSKDQDLYKPETALIHAQKAVKYSADKASPRHRYYAYYMDTLSIAQSANNQFDKAIKSATIAIELLEKENNTEAAAEVSKHLELFKAHKTYRE